MNRTPNVKLFAGISVALIVAGSGLCYYQYTELEESQSRVETLRQEVERQATIAQESAEMTALVTAAKERLGHLELSVSEAAYIPTMLTELEANGKLAGMEVLGVRPVVVVQTPMPNSKEPVQRKKKPYVEFDIEIKGRGPYRSTLNFLGALDQFPKIVAVKQLTLAPKSGGQEALDRPLLDTTLTLRTFVFPPAEKPVDKTAQAKEVDRTDG